MAFFRGANRNIELDVLRGVAILLAMGWHINHSIIQYSIVDWLLLPGREFGWVGVDLFFVLSGFLVGGLILREVDEYGSLDIRRFYVRRIFRLWPVLYIFLLAMLFSGVSDFWEFFPQISLHVQNYWYPESAVHLWSLAVEEHFYIIFSVLIFTALNSKVKIHYLPNYLIIAILSSFLIRFLGSYFGASAGDLQQQTQYRLDGIGCGVLLAYYEFHRPSFFSKLQKNKFFLLVIIILFVIYLCNFPKDSYFGSTVGYFISAIGCSASLLLVYRSSLGKIAPISCEIFSFIGLVSYPLYLWHVPVSRILELIFVDFLPPVVLTPLIYIASISVAAILTAALEKPMMAYRDRLFPPISNRFSISENNIS